jgi:hypothetical protein
MKGFNKGSYLSPIQVVKLNIEWQTIGIHNVSYSLNKYPSTRLTIETVNVDLIISVPENTH